MPSAPVSGEVLPPIGHIGLIPGDAIAPGYSSVCDNETIVFDEPPTPYLHPVTGEVVGTHCMIRKFVDDVEIQVDPHRIFINPPESLDVPAAFCGEVHRCVRETPAPHGWRTRGTVTVVYSTAADEYAYCSSSTYLTAARGLATVGVQSGVSSRGGQYLAATTYRVYLGLVSFDTSSVGTDVISSVTLDMRSHSTYGGTKVPGYVLKDVDWGTTADVSDWRTPAQAGAATTLATISAGANLPIDTPFTWTSAEAFKTATNMGSGVVHGMVVSTDFLSETAPTGTTINTTGLVYYDGGDTTYKPYITIVHTAPSTVMAVAATTNVAFRTAKAPSTQAGTSAIASAAFRTAKAPSTPAGTSSIASAALRTAKTTSTQTGTSAITTAALRTARTAATGTATAGTTSVGSRVAPTSTTTAGVAGSAVSALRTAPTATTVPGTAGTSASALMTALATSEAGAVAGTVVASDVTPDAAVDAVAGTTTQALRTAPATAEIGAVAGVTPSASRTHHATVGVAGVASVQSDARIGSTTVIQSTGTDEYLRCTSTVYATAASGAGTLSLYQAAYSFAGQLIPTTTYQVFQGFVSFDTSPIGATDDIASIVLDMRSYTAYGGTKTPGYVLKEYDWDTSVTTADWRTPAQANAATTLATIAAGTNLPAMTPFTWVSAAAFKNAANLGSGVVHGMVVSTDFLSETAPTETTEATTVLSYYDGDATTPSYRPALTVVHFPPIAVIADGVAGLTVTAAQTTHADATADATAGTNSVPAAAARTVSADQVAGVVTEAARSAPAAVSVPGTAAIESAVRVETGASATADSTGGVSVGSTLTGHVTVSADAVAGTVTVVTPTATAQVSVPAVADIQSVALRTAADTAQISGVGGTTLSELVTHTATVTPAGTAGTASVPALVRHGAATAAGTAGTSASSIAHVTVSIGLVSSMTTFQGELGYATIPGVAGVEVAASQLRHTSAEMRAVAGISSVVSPASFHVTVTAGGLGQASPILNIYDFPIEPTSALVEIEFDGVWVDVTAYALTEPTITRSMGRSGSSTTEPGVCTIELLSTDGMFNFRNVAGPYWSENGWRGSRIRAWIHGVPFISGVLDDYSTVYDMDGQERTALTIRGPLSVPYANSAPADPASVAILGSARPRLFWPMNESTGAPEFQSGLPGGEPMDIAGVIRGMECGAGVKQVGTIEGPPGSPYSFTNLVIESSVESQTELGEDVGPVRVAGRSSLLPFSRWTETGPAPAWDSSGIAVEFALKVTDTDVKFVQVADQYQHRSDPALYPYGSDADWLAHGSSYVSHDYYLNYEEDSVQQTVTYDTLPQGGLVHIRMADGNAFTVSLGYSRHASWSGGESNTSTMPRAYWSFELAYGRHGSPGVILPAIGERLPILFTTTQVQHLLFDDRWHHIQVGIRGGVAVVLIDGSEKQMFRYTRVPNPVAPITTSHANGVWALQHDGSHFHIGTVAMGYLAVRDGTTWPTAPAHAICGEVGEVASSRARRVLTSAGAEWVDGTPSTTPLSAQTESTAADVVAACEKADLGRIIELPTGALTWEPISSRYMANGFTFDLTHDQLGGTPELHGPGNEIVEYMSGSTDGVDAGASATAYAYGYPGGQNVSDTVGVASPARLAAWTSAMAKMRRPNVDNSFTVKLNLAATPELISTWLYAVTHPPISIRIAGVPGVYEPLEGFVDGFDETIGQFDWDVTLNCSPAAPYRAGTLEAGARVTRVDSEAIVSRAYSGTDTSIEVVNVSMPPLDTAPGTFPVDVWLRGERATVSAVSTTTGQFRAAGAAVSGAAGTPFTAPIPGSAVAGDLLLLAVVADGPVAASTPAGWSRLVDSEPSDKLSISLFALRHAGGSDPSIAVPTTPGLAVVAQVAAFAGCAAAVLDSEEFAGGRLTNVSCPKAEWGRVVGPHITVHIAGRDTGWTSITGPAPATMIGELSVPTVGMAWTYGAPRTGLLPGNDMFRPSDGSGSGVVIAAAIAADVQTMTVTRGVNGINRVLAGGETVRMWECPTLAV